MNAERASWKRWTEDADRQLAEARAEIERLRAGLQEIAAFIPPAVGEGDPYEEIAIHSKRKARALLSGETPNG